MCGSISGRMLVHQRIILKKNMNEYRVCIGKKSEYIPLVQLVLQSHSLSVGMCELFLLHYMRRNVKLKRV